VPYSWLRLPRPPLKLTASRPGYVMVMYCHAHITIQVLQCCDPARYAVLDCISFRLDVCAVTHVYSHCGRWVQLHHTCIWSCVLSCTSVYIARCQSRLLCHSACTIHHWHCMPCCATCTAAVLHIRFIGAGIVRWVPLAVPAHPSLVATDGVLCIFPRLCLPHLGYEVNLVHPMFSAAVSPLRHIQIYM
jgi:hypothetical protein